MLKDDVLIESQAMETDYETERGKPMPSINHGQIQANLSAQLLSRYRKQYTIVPEVDLELPNAPWPTVPDLAIFFKKRLKLSKDISKVKDPPITVIEIVSPKQNLEDVKEKIFQNYFTAGIKSAWLIIPTARTVTIYTPDENFITYASGDFTDAVTGISLAIDDVFEDLE